MKENVWRSKSLNIVLTALRSYNLAASMSSRRSVLSVFCIKSTFKQFYTRSKRAHRICLQNSTLPKHSTCACIYYYIAVYSHRSIIFFFRQFEAGIVTRLFLLLFLIRNMSSEFLHSETTLCAWIYICF